MEVALATIPIDAFIIALLALITLYAARPLIQFIVVGLAEVLQNVPAVGGDIANWLLTSEESFYQAISDTLTGWWFQATHPFVQWMDVVAGNIRTLNYAADTHRNTLFLALKAIVNTVLNSGESFASDLVSLNFGSVSSWVAGYVSQAILAVTSYFQTWIVNIEGWADDRFKTIEGEFSTVNDSINAVQTNLVERIDSEFTTLETYAQQLEGYAEQRAQEFVTSAVNAVEGEIRQDYNQLASSIGATITWTEGRLGDLDGKFTAEQAAILTFLTAQVLPRVAAIESDVTECLKPMCESGPGFMQGLTGILGLLSSGVLFTLLAELAANPEAGAQALHAIVDPVEGTAKGLMSVVTGHGLS